MTYDESTITIVREMLLITLKIALPILAAGVLVGLVISIFQTVTSIQDQALVFVPKLIAMLVVAVLITPWIVRHLVEYAAAMFTLV